MNTTAVSTYGSSATAAGPVPAGDARERRADTDVRPIGSGRPTDAHDVVVPLDAFAKQGGPDAEVATGDGGMIQVHAVFQMDPTTRELTVSVVDAEGRLIRMIPPDSVAHMLAAMATYRGR